MHFLQQSDFLQQSPACALPVASKHKTASNSFRRRIRFIVEIPFVGPLQVGAAAAGRN
jgi:hypothetical protein